MGVHASRSLVRSRGLPGHVRRFKRTTGPDERLRLPYAGSGGASERRPCAEPIDRGYPDSRRE